MWLDREDFNPTISHIFTLPTLIGSVLVILLKSASTELLPLSCYKGWETKIWYQYGTGSNSSGFSRTW